MKYQKDVGSRDTQNTTLKAKDIEYKIRCVQKREYKTPGHCKKA